MGDKKISELTALTTPDGAEELVVNDGGTSKKITIDNIFNQDIDVTGTVTADGLTVDDGGIGTTVDSIKIKSGWNSPSGLKAIAFEDQSGNTIGQFGVSYSSGVGAFEIDSLYNSGNNSNKVFKASAGGDISFYEDTGTTAKFFWDASAEYLSVGGTTGTFAPINYIGTNGRLGINNGNTAGGTKIQSFATTNANGYLAFEGYDKEYMRITSAGNVGIGTSSPNAKLAFGESGSISFNTSLGGTGTYAEIKAFNGLVPSVPATNIRFLRDVPTHGNDGAICFDTTNAERMRIDSSGNLLVGTTSLTVPNVASVMLLASGANDAYSGNLRIAHGSNGASGSGYADFWYNQNNIGSISQNGTTGVSYNTSSDYRLKTDVQPMTGATERLKALKPVNFEWIADGTRVDGFIAHEAQEVVPEAVTGTKDAMRTEEYEVTPAVLDDDGNVVTEAVMGEREVPDYQGIDQSKLVPLLTAALQEAVAKIETLETRITALEANQ